MYRVQLSLKIAEIPHRQPVIIQTFHLEPTANSHLDAIVPEWDIFKQGQPIEIVAELDPQINKVAKTVHDREHSTVTLSPNNPVVVTVDNKQETLLWYLTAINKSQHYDLHHTSFNNTTYQSLAVHGQEIPA